MFNEFLRLVNVALVSFCLMFIARANAADCTIGTGEHCWSTNDIARASALTAVAVADWSQTRYIARNPDKFSEINPLLPDHPTQAQVNRHFALSMVAYYALVTAIPQGKWRDRVQTGALVWQVGVVGRNAHMGIKMRF